MQIEQDIMQGLTLLNNVSDSPDHILEGLFKMCKSP